MTDQVRKRVLFSLVGVVVAVSLLFGSGLKIPKIDTIADAYFREAIAKAGTTYAVCRIVNACVSVVKESDISVEPFGFGASVALGQLMDPVDDMVERLSDVLVTSIASLGVQKLAYEISVSLVPPVLSFLLFALTVLMWFRNGKYGSIQRMVAKFALIVVVARIFLPISALANKFVYDHYFSERIETVTGEISIDPDVLDKASHILPKGDDGFLAKLNDSFEIKAKYSDLLTSVWEPVTDIGKMVENLLKLTFLYVGVFVFQVILFPIVSFWVLIKFFNVLFQQNIPVIRH